MCHNEFIKRKGVTKFMKNTCKKIYMFLPAAVLVLSLMTACTSTTSSEKKGDSTSQNQLGEQNSSNTTEPSDLGGGQSVMDTEVKAIGSFTTQDVDKNTVTQDIFAEHELTMVNVFATWCSPCVAEMPDLEKLHQQIKDKDVGVVGVVLDVLNERGEIVDEDLERAQLLVKKTGVTYPVLLPDRGYFNGRLTGIEALPETFFVDKNGNIVGESYSGSGGLEDWIEVVETELANLKEGS